MHGNSYLFMALKTTSLFYGQTVSTAQQQSTCFSTVSFALLRISP